MKLLDVVIPVYGQKDKLAECLAALKAQTFQDFRTYLVDDHSPDYNEMRSLYDVVVNNDVRLTKHQHNEGFAASVNDGAAKGTSPLILLLNSDVVLAPDALAAMVYELDEPSVGVVGALLTFPAGSPWGPEGTVQHAGLAFNIWGRPFHMHVGWPVDHPRIRWSDEFSTVTGACLMTRRGLWNKIGGMNKIYGRGTFEDVEYCFAVKKENLRVVFTTKARGTHYVGASISAYNEGYPMKQNELTFRDRWTVIWDEYKLW